MTEASPSLEAADLARLAVFPLPSTVLFPGALLPLHIFEPRYCDMTRDLLTSNRRIAIARLRPGFEADYHGRPPVFEVCCAAAIVSDTKRNDGRFDIVVRGIARVRLLEEHPPAETYRLFRCERLFDELAPRDASIGAWQVKLASLWDQLRPHLPPNARDLRALLKGAETPGESADRVAEALVADPDERQQLLEELDPAERLSRLVTRLDEIVSALKPNRARDGSQLN
jgi:hypothetical protein